MLRVVVMVVTASLGSCSVVNAISGDCGANVDDDRICRFCNDDDPCFTRDGLRCGEAIGCFRSNPFQCGQEFDAVLTCWAADSANCLPGPSCMPQIEAYETCQNASGLQEQCVPSF